MTLSLRLWQKNQDLAEACLHHPFVQGICDGTLERRRFAYFVGQDAFFLEAFARAYTLAGVKSPDWDGFCALHRLTKGVLDELRLHGKYAEAWDVDITSVTPTTATRTYTDFVLNTAWSDACGTTVAALSPCMRLYAWLGQSLAATNPADHDYRDWIRTYSDPEIENLAVELEGLTDRYAEDSRKVHDTYRYAMQCELGFFEAAWRS
jgi:thiaminase/transcriptional activator TenA